MVVREEVQECRDLGALVVGHAGHRIAQLLGDGFGACSHRSPVAHGGGDVVEHGAQPILDTAESGSVGDAIEFDVDERLGARRCGVGRRGVSSAVERAQVVVVSRDPEHRVRQEVNGEVESFERGDDRIDQERHVVGDDVNHRVRALPSVVAYRRRVDPHHRTSGRPSAGGLPVGHGGAVQVLGVGSDEVVGSDVGEVPAQELLDDGELVGSDPRARQGVQCPYEIGVVIHGSQGMRCASASTGSAGGQLGPAGVNPERPRLESSNPRSSLPRMSAHGDYRWGRCSYHG